MTEPIKFSQSQLGDKREDQPWHRQERETSEEYALFELFLKYRDMKKVVSEFFVVEKNLVTINHPGYLYAKNIKRNYAWEVRVKAYDRWIAKNSDDAVKVMKKQIIIEGSKTSLQLTRQVSNMAINVIKPLAEASGKEGKEKPKLFEVETSVRIAKEVAKLWHDLEATNPLADDDNKPFQNEVESAKNKLLEFVDRREENIRKEQERLEAKEAGRPLPPAAEPTDNSSGEFVQ